MKHIVFVFITTVFFVAASPIHAAKLEFVPQTGSVPVNDILSVDVKVDTAGQETSGVDAVINFPNTLFSVDSVVSGTFYTTVVNTKEASRVTVIGYAETGKTVNGSGILATLKLKALAPGTATLAFQCTQGQTNDSNINKSGTGAVDILDCAALQQGTYTVTGTATATPTIVSSITTIPTRPVTTLPNTGFFDSIGILPTLLVGFGMIVIGILPLLL